MKNATILILADTKLIDFKTKAMKKIVLTIPWFLLLLTGCREAKSKTGISMAENAIEAISGQKIDMADAENIGRNKSEVNVVLDGENISRNFENGFGSITASKETIAITIAGGENGKTIFYSVLQVKTLLQNGLLKAKR